MFSEYQIEEEQNEDASIENVIKNINKVISIELKTLLNPIVTEKYLLQNSILGLPFVEKIRNENIKLKTENESIKKFSDVIKSSKTLELADLPAPDIPTSNKTSGLFVDNYSPLVVF